MAARSSKRRVPLAVLLFFLSLVLFGCSPDNITGIGLAPDGSPTLRNCGTWFRAVSAADGRSGRVVWSATKRSDPSEFGVAEVTVGQLPGKDWVEQAPLIRDPRPAVWRFAIQFTDYMEPQTIDVSEGDLVAGQLLVPGRSGHVSDKVFRDDVCGFAPVISHETLLIALGCLLLAIAINEPFLRRRRRRRAVTQAGNVAVD